MMVRSAVLFLLWGCAGVSAFLSPSLSVRASLPAVSLRSDSSGLRPAGIRACVSGDSPQVIAPAVDGRSNSRRSVLAGMIVLVAGAVPRGVHAYDFKSEKSGDAEFDIPDVWIKTASDEEAGTFAFSNPVSGKVLDQIVVREYEAPEDISSTKDVGKIEKIKPSRAFGATSEVDKADMVSASVRKGTAGNVIFYDFDFAIAPKTCSQDKEMLVGSCMYEKIILLSCCVKKGSIYVLEISASAEEWKKNGPSLRSVRDSFRVPST